MKNLLKKTRKIKERTRRKTTEKKIGGTGELKNENEGVKKVNTSGTSRRFLQKRWIFEKKKANRIALLL